MEIKAVPPSDLLYEAGRKTLLHILRTLQKEFNSDLRDATVTCYTPKTLTMVLIPKTEGVVPDPYTSIFCHIPTDFLNKIPADRAYEEFCDQVGETLQQAFLDRREPKRRRPQITMVMIKHA